MRGAELKQHVTMSHWLPESPVRYGKYAGFKSPVICFCGEDILESSF